MFYHSVSRWQWLVFCLYYGSEFTSHAMLRWAAERRILHFIQPGKPTQNANIESLNGKIRE